MPSNRCHAPSTRAHHHEAGSSQARRIAAGRNRPRQNGAALHTRKAPTREAACHCTHRHTPYRLETPCGFPAGKPGLSLPRRHSVPGHRATGNLPHRARQLACGAAFRHGRTFRMLRPRLGRAREYMCPSKRRSAHPTKCYRRADRAPNRAIQPNRLQCHAAQARSHCPFAPRRTPSRRLF